MPDILRLADGLFVIIGTDITGGFEAAERLFPEGEWPPIRPGEKAVVVPAEVMESAALELMHGGYLRDLFARMAQDWTLERDDMRLRLKGSDK